MLTGKGEEAGDEGATRQNSISGVRSPNSRRLFIHVFQSPISDSMVWTLIAAENNRLPSAIRCFPQPELKCVGRLWHQLKV